MEFLRFYKSWLELIEIEIFDNSKILTKFINILLFFGEFIVF